MTPRSQNPDCPFCEENSWATVEEFVPILIPPEGEGGNGPPTMRGSDAFFMACNNCGLIRMHAAEAVTDE